MRLPINEFLTLEEEDIILIALIFIIWTDDNYDKYLLAALIFVLVAGFDKDLLI